MHGHPITEYENMKAQGTALAEPEEFIAEDLARRAIEMANDDVVEATVILESMARSDMSVWRALTDQLLRVACYDQCRAICRAERRVIWNSPNYDAGGNGARIKDHSASLMDWRLPGGKVLRDASKADLIEASAFYRRQAASMQIIGCWLESVAAKVAGKTVGEKLTDTILRKLQDEARERQGATG